MGSERPLRVALIGTGYMGKCHALAWNSVGRVFGDVPHPVLELLIEANDELGIAKAKGLGFKRSSGNWRSAVADPDIDVVSITSPTWMHREMAIEALRHGKHVWCEKPMSLSLDDAIEMRAAARAARKSAILGYNYIQNPMIRLARKLIDDGEIGSITAVRFEMDEDFMADPAAPFTWVSEPHAGSALQEFSVHPLSILHVLVGDPVRVCADESKPYPYRHTADGQRKEVGNCDIAGMLFRMENGAAGVLAVNRSAWGRKGRLVVQVFGDRGTLYYDQERLNELQVYTTDEAKDRQGFRTILAGPAQAPYQRFLPAPGHGLGFNELKVIECREFIRHISGGTAHVVDFETGVRIEQTLYAAIESVRLSAWVTVQAG